MLVISIAQADFFRLITSCLQRKMYFAYRNRIVPTLRHLKYTAPYMHDERFSELSEALKHYNKPPDNNLVFHEISALNLTARELNQLQVFLMTLSSDAAIQ